MLIGVVLLQSLTATFTKETLAIQNGGMTIHLARRGAIAMAAIRPTARYRMGSFYLRARYSRWRKGEIDTTRVSGDSSLIVAGYWRGTGESWTITFSQNPDGSLAWRFSGDIQVPAALRLRWRREKGEAAFGLGEQFVPGPLDGRRYPIWTEEQGIGRGKQPLSTAVNLVVPGAAGRRTTTYAPMGTFITSHRRGALLAYEAPAFFEAGRKHYGWEVWVIDSMDLPVEGLYWSGYSWGEVLHRQAMQVGPMQPLPAWCAGAWVGLQGGWQVVLPRLAALQRTGTPIAALWIQDWCGRRLTRFGSQLWWRWFPDTSAYPDFARQVDSLKRSHGIRTLGYVNSFLATEGPLYDTVLARGYLVRNARGEPYIIRTPGFPAVLVDLTHPEAYAWLRSTLRSLIDRYGLSGWMADYGEWLPWDACLHAGSGARLHNRYARLWAQLNAEAVAGTDAVFFTRSGHTFSPRYSRLFWMGDQLHTWDGRDGLKSTLYAMLHGGLSGMPLNHSDVGGYTTIKAGPIRYRRSRELFLRWAENCALQPAFRTHEGLRPADNYQAYTDTLSMKHFAALAQLHVRLWSYLQGCAQGYGLSDTLMPYAWAPVWRPLWMHCPECKMRSWTDLIFIGPDVLFAPVSRPHRKWIRVRLPSGEWYSLTADRTYSGKRRHRLPAPPGQPCLLIRVGSPIETELRR